MVLWERSEFWVEFAGVGSESAKSKHDSGKTGELSDLDARLAAKTGKKVLYIEDHPINRRLMTNILSKFPGIEVRCAENGEEGLRMMTAFNPDVLLLDIYLPDMSGKDILQRIKKEGSSIPVIAISADAMPETIGEVIALGAMGYVTKPIDAIKLKATMLKAFGS